MNLIPTRVHGFLDYTVGLLLMVSPWLLGFAHHGAETWVPVALGGGAIIYSFFTRYELGVVRLVPMTGHLTLDFLSGVLLAASPWLFGFASTVHWPHVILGLFEIAAALLTQHTPRLVERDDQAHHIAHA